MTGFWFYLNSFLFCLFFLLKASFLREVLLLPRKIKIWIGHSIFCFVNYRTFLYASSSQRIILKNNSVVKTFLPHLRDLVNLESWLCHQCWNKQLQKRNQKCFREGFVKLRHFDKIFVKNKRKKGSVEKHFAAFSPR